MTIPMPAQGGYVRDELLDLAYREWRMFRSFWNTRQCFCCGRWGECGHREIEVARAYTVGDHIIDAVLGRRA